MAIVKTITQIIDLIPTYNDLLKCNCASPMSNYVGDKTLYAFVFDYAGMTFRNVYKVCFRLAALDDVYILFLVKEGEEISRYSDFIVMQRNRERALYRTDWKWDIDEIGLSITSDNVSRNIIYFGTEENDAINVRVGIYGGMRNVKKREPISLVTRNSVITATRRGFPKFEPNFLSIEKEQKRLPFFPRIEEKCVETDVVFV